MPEMPATTTMTSRCSSTFGDSVSRGPGPDRTWLTQRLVARAAAAEHFALHARSVGKGQVSAGEEAPGRAGGEEEVLGLPPVLPAALDFELGEGHRALTGDDRRDPDHGFRPVDAARLADHRRRHEGGRRRDPDV